MRRTPSQERLAATSPPGNPHRRAPSPEPPPCPNPAASAAALPGSPSHHRLPPWSRRHHSFPPKIAPQPPPLASPASRPCSSTSGRGSAPQPSPSTNPDNHQPGRPPSRLLPPTRIRSTPQPSPPDCPCHWARPVPVLRPRPIHCAHLQFRVAQLHNSSGMLMFRAHVLLKRLTDVCVLCLFVCVCVRARVLRWQRHAYPHPLAVVQIGVQAPSK